MEDISTFLPFADIPERGLKCKITVHTTEEMLVLFEQVCRAIINYSNGSVLGEFTVGIPALWELVYPLKQEAS